jgi:valyl-tRNA synthetase
MNINKSAQSDINPRYPRMEKRYDHTKFEKDIYSLWEKSGAFTPQVNKKKTLRAGGSPSRRPFTIIMPPPNANDPLHIGHAREVATQDILIRYQRMKGIPTLWLPGADHAGIETQYVFEKRLAKKGKSRFDFDRNTLYKMIWDYVQKNTGIMEKQLRQLGASCDWSRSKFTLDPDIVKIVYQTFKKLYDDGLVYRGERIVNYCPRCGTAFSQLEVNYIERDDNFYFLDYGSLIIATTRPETIFADVAIAVNAKDKRYKKLIGKTAILPIVGRELPIIADSLVDPDFGTGALKVTPGHDATDFEIGQKHKLSVISVIDENGRMTNTPKKYIGMTVKKAREKVVADLEKTGKIKKVEKIHHTIGVCYRDKSPIEPTISKQWFIKVEPLAKKALEAINKGQVKFAAKKYEKIAKHWLKNLRDWNISRQIVWGIRIPAWQCEKCFDWTITDGEIPKKCSHCKFSLLTQDVDTFDTWFSSSQWPHTTLKTTKKGDFEYFYPTSVMDPSYDILPFWVIRMIMLGIYSTGKVPFKEILLHGLVRDEAGVKISKSKGNVIDPIEMVNKYGADALRMASIWGSLVENDNSLSENNIRGQRNFSNKIWNIARFVLQSRTPSYQLPATSYQSGRRPRTKNKDDKWILDELKKTTKKVTRALDKYKLNEAAEEIYDFVWHKFADIYLEKSKEKIGNWKLEIGNSDASTQSTVSILHYVLNVCLRLLHPFMPFVTEAIYQQGFAKGKKDLLITSDWPKS